MTIPQAVGLGIAGDELGKKIAGNEVSVGRTVTSTTLSGGKASWLVLYDAPGADRKEGEHIVFGDLLRHD